MEAVKAVIVAVNEENKRRAMGIGYPNATEAMRPQNGSPSLKQLAFDWNTRDKMEITNIFSTKHLEQSDAEKVPIIKKRLGREGL